jgi:hypothetical protein
MWLLLTLAITVTPIKPGLVDIGPQASSTQVYVEGDDCEVKVDGRRISGEPGCEFTVAVIGEDGKVSRRRAQLPGEQFAEDVPAPMSTPPVPQASPTPSRPVVQATPRTKAASSQPSPNQETTPQKTQWSGGASAYLSRDIGPFGFVSGGIAGRAIWNDRLSIQLQLERGTGRAETDLLDVEEAIEQSLFLVLLGLDYQHHLTDGAYLCVGALFGTGRITAEAISDDRTTISESVQPIFVARPSAGIGWRTGPVSVSLGWQATFAQGQYYSADNYGETEGSKPPENEGLLSQGLELKLGVNF